MPTYDFKCYTCGQSATLITGIDRELSIPICTKCKREMNRDYSFGSISFKGEGFYSTDKGK